MVGNHLTKDYMVCSDPQVWTACLKEHLGEIPVMTGKGVPKKAVYMCPGCLGYWPEISSARGHFRAKQYDMSTKTCLLSRVPEGAAQLTCDEQVGLLIGSGEVCVAGCTLVCLKTVFRMLAY